MNNRAIDKLGKTLDFTLSKRRIKSAATKFLARALEVNGLPQKIVIDQSGANPAGIGAVDIVPECHGFDLAINELFEHGEGGLRLRPAHRKCLTRELAIDLPIGAMN